MKKISEIRIDNRFDEELIENNEPNIEAALKIIFECKENGSTELDLRGLYLRELPVQIYELKSLISLDLRTNPLEVLDERICNLISLQSIFLSKVKFKELPNNFFKLKDLKIFHLEETEFNKFPEQLCSLIKLESINLSRSKISELSEDLNKLNNLQTLWLLDNPIISIHHLPSLLNRIRNLSVLGTKIGNYSFLKELHNIENFSLGSSKLKKLPREIFDLKTLRRLHICDSGIQYIPDEIRNLENLEELYIFDSELKRIPDSIENLKKLNVFWIVSNMIETLPRKIGNLNALKKLALYGNNLKEIPSEIGNLSCLIELDLHKNELSKLPPELGNLKNLQVLDVSFNRLGAIPTEFAKLQELKEFDINQNDTLISPPKHVKEQGIEAILGYLKDLTEEVNVWSSKLVIVGEGQVGKSCLLDSLQGNPFEKGKSTTHALNLSQLNFKHPSQDCFMELNVWDFGGQDIYHATHQFYLTNHSLFILVWSARAGYEAGKIYKWLETISALAPDSPIFIVATNSDERGADLPKGDIMSLYPNKIFFFEVDNELRTGIDELKEFIRQKTAGLKYMGIGRPRSWMNSLNSIKAADGYYISKQDIFELFYKNGVSRESYESLACYLHDLGDILYYPEEEELNDTIIIKPEWVSKQIAKILDSDELSKNEGFLNKKLLQELWHDIETNMQEKLITLMEKFDLSYKTKDDKEISLIVEKLKFEEHEDYVKLWENFTGNNEIVFKYQLDTIPAGIPTWFIARTHRFSIRVHWRYGVILKAHDGKHLGLLVASPERKEIWLKVKGDMPFYFFAQLRDTLELTFNRFEGLRRPAFVPCPGHHGKPCSHLFELKQLEKRISIIPPKEVIECPESLEDVNVMKLIFGLSFAPNNEILVEMMRNEMEILIKQQNQLQTNELIKFTQLEFVKLFQTAQEIADITCPNTFTLQEIKTEIKTIDQFMHFKLQLYCQMPGCNHSIGFPYDVQVPKSWVLTIAPYYNKMLKILKYTLPLAIPGVKSILDDAEFDIAKPYIDALKEYNKNSSELNKELSDLIEGAKNTEMPIRQIRRLLDSVDPSNQWAGLKRLVTPEGHVLWLCKEHFAEYKK